MRLYIEPIKLVVDRDFETWYDNNTFPYDQPVKAEYKKGHVLRAVARVANLKFPTGVGFIVYDENENKSFTACRNHFTISDQLLEEIEDEAGTTGVHLSESA